jgi:hypothetical protein
MVPRLLSWSRRSTFMVGLIILAGCGRGQPVAKYRPEDRNVSRGQVSEWKFDSESVGGLPAGAEVFSGE